MKKRWFILVGLLAFSITLAIVVGLRLASQQALTLALAVAAGAATGTGLSMILLRDGRQSTDDVPPKHVSIVLPRPEAEKLIKMLNTRQQADPDAFPITAEEERRFVAVGGASLDEGDYPASP